MGKPTGFKEFNREVVPYREPLDRVQDFGEIFTDPPEEHLKTQGARCMDCGVPFCQSSSGCPINNLIPEWTDLVYHGRWRDALDRLHKTNNFPEFTGRTCPAPCEGACVLGIIDPAVTIKNIENAIIDRGFAEGWVTPQPPVSRTGKKLAIVGSGPAGLAAAAQLNRAGHEVTVYERADRIGGLLMYGIPNMKLDKGVVERRVQLLREEGVKFVTCAHVGPPGDFPTGHMTETMQERGCEVQFIDPNQLREENDALLLATGATQPFDPMARCPGRELAGIFFCHGLLDTQHQKPARLTLGRREFYVRQRQTRDRDRRGRHGGPTASVRPLRHGCASMVNFELLARPPVERADDNPWPDWPRVFRVDYSHAESKEKFGSDPRSFLHHDKGVHRERTGLGADD